MLTYAVLDELMVSCVEGVKAQPVARINPSPAHLNLERKTINSAFCDWHWSSTQPALPVCAIVSAEVESLKNLRIPLSIRASCKL